MENRNRVLSLLRAQSGAWVSGQELGEQLGMTRSALWKHVVALRRRGHQISATRGKGYCYDAGPDRLETEEIQAGLGTESLGRTRVVHFDETDSTQSRARELAAAGAPHGTLVVAEGQTGGRGRKGRTWFSPAREGIYASLVLRPPLTPTQAPRITLLSAVAVADALIQASGLQIHIKWPNDLLVGERKLAGILTEMSAEMDSVAFAIVGLGLNVNTARFPTDLRGRATSLLLESGQPHSRVALLQRVLEQYERWYTVFLEQGFPPVARRWRELSRMLGRTITVDSGGQRQTAVARDIDEDGRLIIERSDGRSERLFAGDIRL